MIIQHDALEGEVGSSFSVQFKVESRGVNVGRAITSMGGPTTSRGRIVVVTAFCCGGSVLPSARWSPCVHTMVVMNGPQVVILRVS